ncbi:hypothetical protein N0V93_001314 [Gnomoniopsis smithogilvyi]|uniref:SH3 domain-containing protein n=1 Tax=Gnomoniopsis smithogilvyi TaxID=1191159 RepID=A0A9W8Z3Q6_9PEZI|nr:hypothetical protein N0V93_001314 [Gnomoniopsis smithogilvyi]
MTKTYIATCDFTPRTPGELCIAKYDHIDVSDIGNGWAWGKNLTQGGAEGTFPRRYLARSGPSGFYTVVEEVAEICFRMDMLIAKSVYLTSYDHRTFLSKRITLRSRGPLSYLNSGCAGGIWEECLHNFVSAFEEAKVKAHEYLLCVENLKLISSMLDKCIPGLVDQVRKYAQVQPSVLKNVECMQATLKGLIHVAIEAFELYKVKGTAKTCPLRLPQRSATSLLSGSTLRITTSMDISDPLGLEPRQSVTLPARHLLLSYASLQALTIVTCITACCIQFRSYILSTHTPGDINSPDFYNNLQTVSMQLLTTYTGLVPTIRSKSVRGLVSVFWVSLLSIAGLVLNFVSLGIYFHDDAMAPLLGFFGNVLQALVVLQLAIRIDGECEFSLRC